MKARRFLLPLAAFLIAATSSKADILVLKNGEKKEGKILEERADAVKMEYIVVGKIKDIKEFPRADVAQIIKQKPEELEIVPLRKTLPTPDLLSADQYEQIIQDRLKPFVNKYSGTEQAKEVEAMIEELQKEKDKVVAGQAKVEGEWLSAEMVKRDEYNLQAYRVRLAMQEKATKLDYIGALRDFDRLSAPDVGYPASLHYVKAIPEVLKVMDKYEAVLARMIADQPVLQKQRDDSLKKMVEPDLGRAKGAIESEKNQWAATYDAEKKSKVKWLTQYKYDLKALQEAMKTLVAERGKLKLMDMEKLKTQNEALTKALRYLADGNALEADAAMKAAQAVAMKESSKIMGQLRTRLTTLKAEQAKNKVANRTFGAGSTAVGGNSGAIADDRVAQAMADADAKKATGTAGDKKEGEDKPAADKPDATKESEPEVKTKSKTKTKASKKAVSSESSDEALVKPMVEEESNTQTYLIIAAAVLVVVLLAAFLLQKKKSK